MDDLQTYANRALAFLVRHGVRFGGLDWFEVRGRRSGQLRGVVVNPLTLGGRTYLLAPRGETQWVRNLRAAGTGRLRRQDRMARELPRTDGDQRSLLQQAYLERWGWQVKQWMTADTDPAGIPMFELLDAQPARS